MDRDKRYMESYSLYLKGIFEIKHIVNVLEQITNNRFEFWFKGLGKETYTGLYNNKRLYIDIYYEKQYEVTVVSFNYETENEKILYGHTKLFANDLCEFVFDIAGNFECLIYATEYIKENDFRYFLNGFKENTFLHNAVNILSKSTNEWKEIMTALYSFEKNKNEYKELFRIEV